MDEMRGKLREVASSIGTLAVREYIGEANDYIAELEVYIDQILSLETDTCRIAVVDREAELPEPTGDSLSYESAGKNITAWVNRAIYSQAQHDMLKEGWVQEVKDAL